MIAHGDNASNSVAVSPNNPLQRSSHDKVHAPNCHTGFRISDIAPHVRRAAAERDR
jgi:hypothetical protein